MAPPAFDDDLSFSEGVEDLAIEQLIAQAGIFNSLEDAVTAIVAATNGEKARQAA